MKRIIPSIALLIFPLLSVAQIETEIAKAAAIENSVQRLAAYDAIAEKYDLAPGTKVEKETEGRWSISTDVSPIDDSKTVICRLDADASVRVGYDTIKPTMIVRYKEGELEAYIVYDTFLGTDSIPVTLRFGKGNAENATWSISTDHKATFIRGDIAQFINKMERVDSLVVRLTPYGESPVTISFSPKGVDKVKDAIRKAM
jgi:type VI secretion system protein VasI